MAARTYGCKHWSSPLDIVALKCSCHGEFHACLSCHADVHNRPPAPWPRRLWDTEKAVKCRACDHEMTITAYMACDSACPSCDGAFNPGCRKHWPLYFDMPGN